MMMAARLNKRPEAAGSSVRRRRRWGTAVLGLLLLLLGLPLAPAPAAAAQATQEAMDICRRLPLPAGLRWRTSDADRDYGATKLSDGNTRLLDSMYGGLLECWYAVDLPRGNYRPLAQVTITVDIHCRVEEAWRSNGPLPTIYTDIVRRLATEKGTPLPETGRTETRRAGRLGPVQSESFSNLHQVVEMTISLLRPRTLVSVRTETIWDPRQGPAPPLLTVESLQEPALQLVQTDGIRAMQQRLQNCADAAPPAPAATLGLACDPQELQATGRATCVAPVANARPDARLIYEWTVDGQVRAGVTGRELTLTGLSPGTHQISVLVRDVQSGTSLGPERVSLTRGSTGATGAPGATGAGTGAGAAAKPSGTFVPSIGSSAGSASSSASSPPAARAPEEPDDVSPVVAGSAVAVAAAVAMLTLDRLRRRRRPPDEPSDEPPAAPPGRPAAPPTTLPEGVGRRPAPPARPATLPESLTSRTPPSPRPADPITGHGSLGQVVAGQVVGGAPPPTPSPGPAGNVPPGPPEREQRLGPQLYATLRLSASPRPDSTTAAGDLRLWGDGVDLVWADYDLMVTPGWEIVGNKPTHVALVPDPRVATQVRVTPFVEFRSQLTARYPALPPLPVHDFAVQAENWGKRNYQAPLRLEVTTTVRHAGTGEEVPGLTASEPASLLTATVLVVAANPKLLLEAGTTGANGEGVQDAVNPGATNPSLQGYADGVSVIWLTPRLLLFDEAYPGGLAIATVPAQVKIADLTAEGLLVTNQEVLLDTYFEAKPEDLVLDAQGPAGAASPPQLDPHRARRVQRLRLRGRFHLEDQAIKDLGGRPLQVHCGARPTGEGPGQDEVREWFDYMAGEHYRAVAARVGPHEAAVDDRIDIGLLPSTIDIKPTPDLLPANRNVDFKDPKYYSAKSVIKATVRSAHPDGYVVPGTAIDTDRGRAYARSWKLTFSLGPPQALHCPRRYESCNCTRATTPIDLSVIKVEEVNTSGQIVCSDTTATYEEFEYNHLAHFNRAEHRGYWGNGAHVTVAVNTPDGTFPDANPAPAPGAVATTGPADPKRQNQIRIEVEPPADMAIWAFGRGTGAEPSGQFGKRGTLTDIQNNALVHNTRYLWFAQVSTHEDFDLFRCEKLLSHEFRHYDFEARRNREPRDDRTDEEGYQRIRCTATTDYACHDFAWRTSGRTAPVSLANRINPDVVSDLARYGLSEWTNQETLSLFQPGDVVAYLNPKASDGARRVAGHSGLVLRIDPDSRVRMESKDNSGSRFRHWLGLEGPYNYFFEDYAGHNQARLRVYRRGSGHYLLRPEELAFVASLIVKLKDRTNPLSAYLVTQFTGATQVALRDYNDTYEKSEALRAPLIEELNRLLQGPLYEAARFQGVALTPEITELLARKPQGADLLRLNRRLLEAAYPVDIAKKP